MSPDRANEPVLSAQVVLGSAASESERLTKAYASAGFQVGPLVGISFSITAPFTTFERVFQTAPHPERGELELPLEALSSSLRANVAAVTFTAPPDFGPTSYDR